MSETTTETTEAPPVKPEAPATATEAQSQTFSQDQVNAMLAEQKRKERERFADYDDLKTKASQYDEAQEAAKSEQQRAAEAAQRAQAERDEARAESLRYKAAATHGVDEDNFDLLGIGNEEEIAARAERVGGLLKLRTENEQLRAEVEALRAGKPAPSTSRPVETLRPGATAEPVTSGTDNSYPSHWLPQRQQ